MALLTCLLGLFCALGAEPAARGQEPSAPQATAPAQLETAVDHLGDFDYATRTNAARAIRRTPGAQAVPALLGAVAGHRDGYVRFRALVLVTGFNDARTTDAMRAALVSPNDRLRAVAYGYFASNPERGMVPELLAALDTEVAEFVRPALVRALAALGSDLRVQAVLRREAGRGEDYFRSAVIEALGDFKATYAFETLAAIAEQDGPLLDDAALALGKTGDARALPALAALRRSASVSAQPLVAAGICLLGVDCELHERDLAAGLVASGRPDLVRAAAAGLSALGVAGRASAATMLFDAGVPSHDAMRAPVAIALATIALRNSPLMLSLLGTYPARTAAIALLAEGFDMLEEDLDKERFFALARRTYWESPEGSPVRELMQTLIGALDF